MVCAYSCTMRYANHWLENTVNLLTKCVNEKYLKIDNVIFKNSNFANECRKVYIGLRINEFSIFGMSERKFFFYGQPI